MAVDPYDMPKQQWIATRRAYDAYRRSENERRAQVAWSHLQDQMPLSQIGDVGLQSTNDGAAYSWGGGDKNSRFVAVDNSYEHSPEELRYLLMKELGQANQYRMVRDNARGDLLQRLWGIKNVPPNVPRSAGLVWDWDGKSFDSLVNSPYSVNVHGYQSQPTDVYGTEYAYAAGAGKDPWPSHAPNAPDRGITDPNIINRLRGAGILPQAAGPVRPKQVGAGGAGRLS